MEDRIFLKDFMKAQQLMNRSKQLLDSAVRTARDSAIIALSTNQKVADSGTGAEPRATLTTANAPSSSKLMVSEHVTSVTG
jgi:hypothetical protein